MGSEGTESRVAFLGGGRMGEALLSGLIRSGGRSSGDLMVTARREERVADLGDRLGVTATLSNPEAVQWARTLVLTDSGAAALGRASAAFAVINDHIDAQVTSEEIRQVADALRRLAGISLGASIGDS